MDCQECLRFPTFFCYCSNSYLCAAHLSTHQASRGNHRYENVPETQNSFRKSMLDNKLKNWISSLKQLKKDTYTSTEATIKLIKTSSNLIIKKINSLIKYYLELTTKTNFEISQNEEAKKIIASQIKINEFSVDDLNNQILKTFSVNLLDLINEPAEVERIRYSKFLKNHINQNWCIAISNDGKFLYTGSDDTSIRVWNVACKTVEACLVMHKYGVSCLAISHDDNFLVSGSCDKSLILWDLKKKCSKHVYYGSSHRIVTVAFNSDSSFIVSENVVNEIMTWKTDSTECLRKINGDGLINCGGVFSNFYYEVINEKIEIFDLISFKNIFSLEPYPMRGISSIVLSKNKEFLITTVNDGSIMIWKASTKWLYATLLDESSYLPSSSSIKSVLVTSDDKNIISGYNNGFLILWCILSKQIINRFVIYSDEIAGFVSFGDLIFSVSYNTNIEIFQISSKQFICFLSLPEFTQGSLCKKDELVAYGSESDIRICDLNNEKDEILLKGHFSYVCATCISPKMNLLISASWKEILIIWDLKGKKILSWFNVTSWIKCIDISNDESTAITGGEGYFILWDLVEFRKEFEFVGHQKSVDTVKFIKNGKFAISGDFNQLILWNIEKKCMHSRLSGNFKRIDKILITCDDKYVLSASTNLVRVWEISTEKQVFEFKNLSESKEWLEKNKDLEFELSKILILGKN